MRLADLADPLTVCLALLCLVLGGVVAYQVVTPWTTPPPAASPTGQEQAAPSLSDDFRLPPLSKMNEIVDRPLFLKNRRPAPLAAAPAAALAGPVGKIADYKLSAVVKTPEQQFALLRGNDNKLHRVIPGQEFQGWTLRAVENEAALFEREKQEERLALFRKTPESFKRAAEHAAILARNAPPQPIQGQPPNTPNTAGVPNPAAIPPPRFPQPAPNAAAPQAVVP
ncbi:MAG: hypothetical protein ACREWG_17050 [Gammaproteobacteria bacterium]